MGMLLKNFTRLLSMFSLRVDKQEDMYDLFSECTLGKRTMYMNLGYWKDTDDYDDSCDNLAQIVAAFGDLKPGDHLLDCGCGYGDAAFYWKNNTPVSSVDSITLNKGQVNIASHRAKIQSIKGVNFHVMSATKTDFDNESFDVVFALESSMHFVTRESFLKEAYRVLRPGGRLVIADICPSSVRENSFKNKVADLFWLRLHQVPKKNFIKPEAYEGVLCSSGFTMKHYELIGEYVHKQFREYWDRRIQEPTYKEKISFFIRILIFLGQWTRKAHDAYTLDDIDYIVCASVKV